MPSIHKRESVSATGKRTVRYDATVTRRGAKRQTKTFATRAAAEKWAKNIEYEIEAGTWVDRTASQRMTVADALDIYLAEVVPHLKSAACEPPKALNLKRRLGNMPLSGLSTIDLAGYRDRRLQDKARRAVGSKGAGTVELDRTVSPQTVRHELGLLSRALSHVEHEHGVAFPRGKPRLDHRRSNALALPPGRDRILTADETARLLSACKFNEAPATGKYAGLRTSRSPLLLAAVEFMIETAARPGEVVALKWSGVNTIEETVTLKNKKTKRSKAPETRTIPMSPRVKALIDGMPAGRASQSFVFGGVTRSALYQQFRRALKRAEIKDFSTRDLRHVGATNLATVLKGDLLMLSDMTGHQDIRMLRRYVAPRRKQIADLLAQAQKGEPENAPRATAGK
jgi:integrase